MVRRWRGLSIGLLGSTRLLACRPFDPGQKPVCHQSEHQKSDAERPRHVTRSRGALPDGHGEEEQPGPAHRGTGPERPQQPAVPAQTGSATSAASRSSTFTTTTVVSSTA